MYIKFTKTRDVKSPCRANPSDAGVDLYVPNTFESITLQHGESILIPSGIKVEVPFGYAFILYNKSGIAVKKSLHAGAAVVDAGYSGEIHINLVNNGNAPQDINPGDKIIQGILIPILLPELIEVPEEELYRDIHVAGSRGAGGFGSTGK